MADVVDANTQSYKVRIYPARRDPIDLRNTSEVVAPLTQRLVNAEPGLRASMRLNRRATYPPSLAPTPAPVESPKARYLIGPVIESLNLLREMFVSFAAGAVLSRFFAGVTSSQ